MFIGEYSHNLDDKGRVAVPAKFRAMLKGGAVVTKGLDNCLFVFPQREWQKLARGMHPRSTNGAAPAVETSTGQPKAVGEATHELTALAGGVFQYLADRPDGAPLVEIEKEIQLDRFGAVRALKRLMDDGKAEKRGRLYFAA